VLNNSKDWVGISLANRNPLRDIAFHSVTGGLNNSQVNSQSISFDDLRQLEDESPHQLEL